MEMERSATRSGGGSLMVRSLLLLFFRVGRPQSPACPRCPPMCRRITLSGNYFEGIVDVFRQNKFNLFIDCLKR